MVLSRTAAFRLLAVSLLVTFVAAGVAVFGVMPALWFVVLLGIATFWYAIVQLVRDAGRRVRSAVRDFTAEFAAAVGGDRRGGEPLTGAPIELGELRRLDD